MLKQILMKNRLFIQLTVRLTKNVKQIFKKNKINLQNIWRLKIHSLYLQSQKQKTFYDFDFTSELRN